jgi:hypothetical protein
MSLEIKKPRHASVDGIGRSACSPPARAATPTPRRSSTPTAAWLPERARRPPTTENVTISREYVPDRDGPLRKLFAARGRGGWSSPTSRSTDGNAGRFPDGLDRHPEVGQHARLGLELERRRDARDRAVD